MCSKNPICGIIQEVLFKYTCMHYMYIYIYIYICVNLAVIRDSEWVEPMEFWENADTKRRLHNLVTVSGALSFLTPLRARLATEEEITLFHTKEYFQSVKDQAEKGTRYFFALEMKEVFAFLRTYWEIYIH